MKNRFMKILTKRKKRILRGVLALVIAAVISSEGPLSILVNEMETEVKAEEAVSELYISDVSVGSEAELKAAGYTVIDGDMNATDGTASYLGYKTTDNKDDAITDVSALGMYGGYKELTYKQLLNEQKDNFAEAATKLKEEVVLFRKNYKAGTQGAQLAYEMLNSLYVPDDDEKSGEVKGTPLGDYFLNEDLELDDFQNISFISSTAVSSYIYQAMAVADYDDSANGTTTWITRLCANGPLVFTDEETGEVITDESVIDGEYEASYDSTYSEQAKTLYTAIQTFAADYNTSVEHSGGEPELDMTESETEELQEAQADTIPMDYEEESLADAELTEEEEENAQDSEDALYIGIYKALDEKDDAGNYVYPYGTDSEGNPRSLAQFLIEVGSMDESLDTYRLLYPFLINGAAGVPLTNEELNLLPFIGFTSAIILGQNNSEYYSQAAEQLKSSAADLISTNNGNRVSVWFNVKKEFYGSSDQKIYWTYELAQKTAVQDRYDLLTKETIPDTLSNADQIKNKLLITSACVFGVYGACMVTGYLLSKFVGTTLIGAMISYFTGTSCSVTGAALMACTVGGVIQVAAIAVVVIIILALIIWKLIDYFSGDDDEPDLEMKEIPDVIYDYTDELVSGGAAVEYKKVTRCGTTTAANLNDGLKNTPWVVLYYSKDASAGEPITVEMLGDTVKTEPFAILQGNSMPLENYCPLTALGTQTAYNLNEENSYGTAVYGCIHREGNYIPKAQKTGKYLSDVMLVSSSDPEKAKLKLENEGFSLIDYNLVRDYTLSYKEHDDLYAYIGYKTTDNEDDALTDLRVGYYTGASQRGDQVLYGRSTYGCCGMANQLALFETGSSLAGTPILAQSLIVTNKHNAPAGYEAVISFTGGTAFDFNSCGCWQAVGSTMKDMGETLDNLAYHTFIYFNPSVHYTSGTQYISGLAFFAGEYPEWHAKYLGGWTKLSDINLQGTERESVKYATSEYSDTRTSEAPVTNLYYSTTYNPYRAICDIKFYQYTPQAETARFNFSYGSTGYMATDVYESDYFYHYIPDLYGMRYSHCYRSCNVLEGGNEDLSCVALYVTGVNAGTLEDSTPIKVGDLTATASADFDSSTTTPVRDLTDAYSETGANLAYTDSSHKDAMYLYMNRADAARGKYIKTVDISYANKGKDSTATASDDESIKTPFDDIVFNLVSNGKGSLLDVNLSSDEGHNSENYRMAYMWVTYTNTQTESVTDLYWYDTDSETETADATLTTSSNGKVTLCGDGFKVKDEGAEGKYHFLYCATGGSYGITDIDFDNVPIRNDGTWTTITTENTASDYTFRYMHATHLKSSRSKQYISGVYYGSGKTSNDAMMQLLDQGCRFLCPFNVNRGGGDIAYVGYGVTSTYKKAYSGMYLMNNGQDDTVSTLIHGRDSYDRIISSLNPDVTDAITALYATQSTRKAKENGATTAASGHYITQITFFNGQDLEDYVTEDADIDEISDPNLKAYVQSMITDSQGEEVHWNIVTDPDGEPVNVNVDAAKFSPSQEALGMTGWEDEEVYMYVHYSDNWDGNSSLLGSLFGGNVYVQVIFLIVIVLGGLAIGYLYLKRRKQKIQAVSNNIN